MYGLALGRAGAEQPNSIQNAALGILRKFGTDAHVYLPGSTVTSYGPELVTNGDFSQGTAGWVLTQPTSGSVGVVGGAMRINSVDATPAKFSRSTGLSSSKSYLVSFDAVVTSGTAKLENNVGDPAISVTTSGPYSQVVTSLGSSLVFNRVAACDISFDNISVREVITTSSVTAGLPTNNYTLSDGSTGYSAIDGTAGRVLDGAGSVGAELNAYPGSPFTSTTGYAVVGTGGSGALVSGELELTATAGNYPGLRRAITTVADATYKVTATIRRGTTASNVRIVGPGSVYAESSSTGATEVSCFFKATSTTSNIDFSIPSAAANGTAYMGALSVREVTGIHATQATTANKPALRRGLYNLLLQSKDGTNASWTKTRVTTSAGAGFDGLPSTLLTWDGTTTNGYEYQAHSAVSGQAYTVAAIWRPGTAPTVMLQSFTQYATCAFTLTGEGSKGAIVGLATQASIVAVGSGAYLIAMTFVANATASNNVSPGVISGTADFIAGGLFQGTLTAAQILAEGGIPLTTSAAASNQSAGRYWWGTDSGDSLALGSVPFQFTDDFFVCVGAACNNKAVYPGVFESLGGTARIYSYFDAAGITVTQFKDDAGTSTYITGPSFSDGASVVLSSYKQSGQVCTGLNGTDGTPQAAPAGTFTLSSSKLLNGLDGKMAAGVIIKGQVSAADRLILKRWVAANTLGAPSF